ncbi:MAG: sulfotransferase domain-containing protein [Anaerolineales bacterium]|nr:sulfotransferase domain-containing protein [Anaerolineales bacterium]
MIILSVGMPRAGSGWYYNLTNDLALANGAQDARQIRQRYHLQKILTEVNCNIGALTPRRLLRVLVPSLLGHTFVIKAHAAPTPFALFLIRSGQLLTTYIYRDPRDALLSAYENGQRARSAGRDNAFAQLVDFEAALQFMQDYVRISEAWLECRQALRTRYENLLLDYDAEAQRLVKHMRLPADTPRLESILDQYRPEAAQPDQKGLHFSHGKIGRFRQKMTPQEQERMTQAFQPYLVHMGYPLD